MIKHVEWSDGVLSRTVPDSSWAPKVKLNLSMYRPWRCKTEWKYNFTHIQARTKFGWMITFTTQSPFSTGWNPAFSIDLEVGRSPEEVWTLWRTEKSPNLGGSLQTGINMTNMGNDMSNRDLVNTKQECQFSSASFAACRLNPQHFLPDGCASLFRDEGMSSLVIHVRHVKLF